MLEKFEAEVKDFRDKSALREAVAELLDDCKQHAKWLCDYELDEEGKRKQDEKGNTIYKEPEKDSYNYKLMQAYLQLAQILSKTV